MLTTGVRDYGPWEPEGYAEPIEGTGIAHCPECDVAIEVECEGEWQRDGDYYLDWHAHLVADRCDGCGMAWNDQDQREIEDEAEATAQRNRR